MAREIIVNLFGQFKIQSGEIRLDSGIMRSHQLVRLLAYLLIYRNRKITQQELIDVLWEDGIDHPAGALKNLVYRLRNALKQLGDEKYVITHQGSYSWNKEIPVIIDAELFEEKSKEARNFTGNPEERIALYEEALRYCKGTYLADFSMETWQVALATYYHSLYLTITKELAQLYGQNESYEKLGKLTKEALIKDNLDEELHYWAIKGLMGQGKINLALLHYEEASRLLYKNLGIRSSDKLRQVYKELMSIENIQDANVDDICEDIEEQGVPVGVFFCEYPTFKEIYRLEVRRIARLGASEYVLLLTLQITMRKKGTREQASFYLECLKDVLNHSLRMGDVASCYSESQYIVLLQTCTYETGTLVAERILDNFRSACPDHNVKLIYELKEIETKYLRSC